MKILIVIICVAAILCGCSFLSSSSSTKIGADGKTYRRITMQEAIEIMNSQNGYIILDVRRPDEFASGHIPGAINVPNENIGSDEIPRLTDKNQLILVYCRSGNRSKQASAKLVSLGYTNIVEFGGILDWPGDIVTE